MREFGQDYLFKVTIEPEIGYRHFEKKKKPYYVVAANKDEACNRLNLKSGWKVSKVSLLGEQLSGVMFGGNC